jgi:hypothetical protein
MTSLHPSPYCPLCSTSTPTIETQDHFLFECPFKYHVWQTIYYTYIKQSAPSPSTNRITITMFHQLLYLSSPTTYRTSHPLFPSLTTSQIFACTLQCIWQSHWRFIFNDIPFQPSSIIKTIARLLLQLDSELQLDSGHGDQ